MSVYIEDVILLEDDFGWDLEIDGLSAAVLFLQLWGRRVPMAVLNLQSPFKDVLCLSLLVCVCLSHYPGNHCFINVAALQKVPTCCS